MKRKRIVSEQSADQTALGPGKAEWETHDITPNPATVEATVNVG